MLEILGNLWFWLRTFVIFKSVTFEFFGKCSVYFDVNNDLQEDLKLFKGDTFENYKSFVPVEVQSQCSFKDWKCLINYFIFCTFLTKSLPLCAKHPLYIFAIAPTREICSTRHCWLKLTTYLSLLPMMFSLFGDPLRLFRMIGFGKPWHESWGED